jgi:ATP-dependent RNA helicase RhlE
LTSSWIYKEVVMAFRQFTLDPHLHQAVRHAGFLQPTPIQTSAIPLVLEGHDVIGTAQTGTGKTAAFVLPILHRLLTSPPLHPGHLGPRCLVVTPTRELALQVLETFKTFSQGTAIRCAAVFGGVGYQPQELAFRKGTEVIVSCPGRLLDHIKNNTADMGGVEVLVMDEADRMLDMGFLPDIKRIIAKVPKERQTLLFSATFDEKLKHLIADSLKHPKRIAVDPTAPAHTVAHWLYPVPQHLKTSLLVHLMKGGGIYSAIIFTRTKHRANRIFERLEKEGFKVGVLHANKSQNARQAAIKGFRENTLQILVATDIASRGLDIEHVTHVINYDIPDTTETYIHRIGRTGRAERKGDAFSLVTNEDLGMVEIIEKALGTLIEQRWVEGFDYHTVRPQQDEFKRGPKPQRRGDRGSGNREGRSDQRSASSSQRSSGRSAASKPGTSHATMPGERLSGQGAGHSSSSRTAHKSSGSSGQKRHYK